MNINEMMEHIQELDEDATLDYSAYTNLWYVHANLEIGGDGMLASPVAGAETPKQAVAAFWERITNLPVDRFLVVDAMRSTRRHFRWDGGAWLTVPRPDRGRKGVEVPQR